MPRLSEDGFVASESAVVELSDLVRGGDVVVLSGAGLSTESGIPDYRGATGAAQRRYTPMTYATFTGDSDARRRYWARSHLGWQHMARALPNAGHLALAELERRGHVRGTITQNVDGLHGKAGSRNVIELHGRLDQVRCLSCGVVTARHDMDARLREANADWSTTVIALNPDGDAEVPDSALDSFVVVDCNECGGLLKPDVVYFGESVPAERVAAAYDVVARAAMVLVLGSSLHVFSGRRFVQRAAQEHKLVAIVNDGPTRCDDLAYIKVNAPLGATLQTVLQHLPPS